MSTTKSPKGVLKLAHLTATLKAEDGPFTFVVDGALPSFAAAPNVTALLLSRATGAPVKVLDKTGKEVAVADAASLEVAERERLLLREASGRKGREVPLTKVQEAMAALLKRPEGCTRAELVQASGGKGVSPLAVAKKLAKRLGLEAAKDLNAEPPRFWLKATEGQAPAAKVEPRPARGRAGQQATAA